jgi:alpha-tubulin suppressor-like RCC1 family protein
LIDSSSANDVHIFNLTTRDQGVTWYGYEAMKNDPAEPVPPAQLWFMGGGTTFAAQNDNVQRSSPVQIPGTQWKTVWGGYNEAAAIKSDGTLWAWGANNTGSLGQNETANRSSPIQVPGTGWSFDKIGGGQACITAIKTDGTLWTWGEGEYGKLAQNDQANRSSPKQVPGTQWSEVSDNAFHANHFLKTDGTLWTVGSKFGGMLGLNDQVDRSSPTQIPGTSWSSISAGYYHTIATKTNGTLWTWGYNYGYLGLNFGGARSSPVQIPGTQWNTSRGYMGGYGSGGGFAIKTDGTLWMWGNNGAGSLGQNGIVPRSSPTQIPGTQWSRVTGGPIFSNLISAQKTDGTLWVWGAASAGKLGQNDVANRSSPTQIPGTWSKSDTGGAIFAIKN